MKPLVIKRRAVVGAVCGLLATFLAGHAATNGGTTTTVYINRYFEVRAHEQPVKYVFNGETRISRVIGSLSTEQRVQRLRFFPGWNLCSLAVAATNLLAQLTNSS